MYDDSVKVILVFSICSNNHGLEFGGLAGNDALSQSERGDGRGGRCVL